MNLQSHIKPELWLAISSTYEGKHYSSAILNAMHYLSSILREKTGLDGDGASLVGQALGGESPRLRVNKLQTETERNVQKGLEQILRGMYLAIRNPRSHEQIEDTQEKADAIIYFINFVLDIISQSEEPYILAKFMARVFDPDFVTSDRYAELMAAEIPPNKISDTLIEIYRKRTEGDGKKLAFIVRAITNRLSPEQLNEFLTVVSEDLKTVQNETSIKLALQLMPPQFWPRVAEVTRLRIENKLISSIREGEVYVKNTHTMMGYLGTY